LPIPKNQPTVQKRSPQQMSWIFISDIHFSKPDLKRLQVTTAWILEQLKNNAELRHVFILGDTLHTRNDVHVEALFAASDFIRKLALLPSKPRIHLLVGNHDMYFLKSRQITSLDAFDVEPETDTDSKRRTSFDDMESMLRNEKKVSRSVRVYREITPVIIDKVPVLFLPFHEDQSIIRGYLASYIGDKGEAYAANTIVMGHLALNGAIINGYSDSSNIKQNRLGDLSINDFLPFKRTFTGHFHHHRTYANKITYVGAPRQIHYGDCGDTQRGFVVYSPGANSLQLVVNPNAITFVSATLEDLHELYEKPKSMLSMAKYKNRFVRLNLPPDADHTTAEVQELVNKLKSSYKIAGWAPFKFSDRRDKAKMLDDIEDAIEEIAEQKVELQDLRQLYLEFVAQAPYPKALKEEEEEEPEESSKMLEKLWRRSRVNMMYQIMRHVERTVTVSGDELKKEDDEESVVSSSESAPDTPGSSVVSLKDLEDDVSSEMSFASDTTGSVGESFFEGDIAQVKLKNFLGVRGEMTINLNQMDPGIWFVLGINGAGKSSLIEAIVWCLFGEPLRSELKVAQVINDYIGKNDCCAVTVTFANGYMVTRERDKKRVNSHRLWLTEPDGTVIEKGQVVDTQREVEMVLGINYETFARSIVLSSGSTLNFIMSTDQEKRLVIEKLLGFDRFTQYEKIARLYSREHENEHNKVEAEIRNLETQYTMIVNAAQTLTNRTEAQARQVEEFQSQITSKQALLNQFNEQMNKSMELNSEYDKKLQEVKEFLEHSGAEHVKLQDQLQKMMQEKSQWMQYQNEEANLNNLQAEHANLLKEQERVMKGSVLEESIEVQREIWHYLSNDSSKEKLMKQSIEPLEKYMKQTGMNHKELTYKKLRDSLKSVHDKIQDKISMVATLKNSCKDLSKERDETVINKLRADILKLSAALNASRMEKQKLEKQGRPIDTEKLKLAIQTTILATNSLQSKMETLKSEMKSSNEIEDQSEEMELLRSKISDLKTQVRPLLQARKECIQFCVNALSAGVRHQQNGFRTFCLSRQMEQLNKLLAINMNLMNETSTGSLTHDLSCKMTDNLQVVECGHGIAIAKRSAGKKKKTYFFNRIKNLFLSNTNFYKSFLNL
jgi:DNA repair exonuclease SbcCD ATPase subunit